MRRAGRVAVVGAAGPVSACRRGAAVPLGGDRCRVVAEPSGQRCWHSPCSVRGRLARSPQVAGCDVDVDRLVVTVPLLYQDEQGRFGAHELWEDAVERIFPAADVDEVRRRALEVFLERGETVRMGSAAVRWGEPDMFRAGVRRARARKPRGRFRSTRRHGGWRTLRPVPRARRNTGCSSWPCGTPSIGSPTTSIASSMPWRPPSSNAVTATDKPSLSPWVPSRPTHAVTSTRLVALTQRIRALPGAPQDPLLQFFVGTFDAARRRAVR